VSEEHPKEACESRDDNEDAAEEVTSSSLGTSGDEDQATLPGDGQGEEPSPEVTMDVLDTTAGQIAKLQQTDPSLKHIRELLDGTAMQDTSHAAQFTIERGYSTVLGDPEDLKRVVCKRVSSLYSQPNVRRWCCALPMKCQWQGILG